MLTSYGELLEFICELHEKRYMLDYIGGLVQDCSNSIVNALELL